MSTLLINRRKLLSLQYSFIFLFTLLLACLLGCDDDEEEEAEKDATVEESDASVEQDAQQSDSAQQNDAEANAEGPVVELDDGVLRGEIVGESRRFLKIPYAKPPVGELRWKAPVPNDPWEGERFETEFVQSCPQLADQGAPASTNEDCLYLNVWAPEPATEKAPVLVWIHGGGNFSGGAGIPIPATEQLWYDGQYFASNNDVILVTFNYRLGPFGFFGHSALADEDEPVGNQGLYDQRAALQWVKDNIDKFGGDPNSVTIFGESAGAGDVCIHAASPGSHGLFHRAIMQSGGCTMRRTRSEDSDDEKLSVVEQMVAFGEAAGCEAGDGQLACLREKTVEELLEHANQPSPGGGETFSTGDWSFGTIVDGSEDFVPDSLTNIFDSGDIADVQYIIGTNNDEGTTFIWQADPLESEEDYLEYLDNSYGEYADEVADLYPVSDFDGDANEARVRVISDSGVICSSFDTALRTAKAGRTVYMYNFNVHWSLLPDVFKAGHAAEMSHVFGNPYVPEDQSQEITDESQTVADGMNAYWAEFARNGDPNHSGAPAEWPEFTEDSNKRLQLDADWEVLEDFRAEACAFWREYFGAI